MRARRAVPNARAGAGQQRVPNEGIARRAGQACTLAQQTLNIVIRAVDYCHRFQCTVGGYLRVMITADADRVGNDPWAHRESLASAFLHHGEAVPDVPNLSEPAPNWEQPEAPLTIEALRFSQLRLDCRDGLIDWSGDSLQVAAAEALGKAVCNTKHGREIGLLPPGGTLPPP